MAVDLPSTDKSNFDFLSVDNVLDAANTGAALVNQYVVSPLTNLGISGFIFDIEDETRIDMTCEITDHYVEDNSSVQDHIAVRPEIVTLRGFVGELVFERSEPASTLQQLTEKITTIAAYVPVLTSFGAQLKNTITGEKQGLDYLDAAVGTGVSLYQTFAALNPPKTKQAKAFNFFRALKNARQLVSLATPYTFYKSMAIMSVSAIQSGDNKEITDFSVTLKQFRTASVSFVAFDPQKYQGRAALQAAPVIEKGQAQGTTLDAITAAAFSNNLNVTYPK